MSICSCGGNILINVGPTHDGRIVPIFEERLTQMGKCGMQLYSCNILPLCYTKLDLLHMSIRSVDVSEWWGNLQLSALDIPERHHQPQCLVSRAKIMHVLHLSSSCSHAVCASHLMHAPLPLSMLILYMYTGTPTMLAQRQCMGFSFRLLLTTLSPWGQWRLPLHPTSLCWVTVERWLGRWMKRRPQ